jgi:hypothetical protein
MQLQTTVLLLSINTLFFAQSCTVAMDQALTTSVKYKRTTVKEVVAFSIAQTYHSSLRKFSAADVRDSAMKKKIQEIGSNVYVNYQDADARASIPDSIVIFTTCTGYGCLDIIYDFATNERGLIESLSRTESFYLRKLDDRTYYRRGDQSLQY